MEKAGNKEPLISVIVPVYNVEKYVGKCLDSIINQTYKNLEIIVIDDGSTDSSNKICKNYAKKDRRIKIIHQKNAGLSVARNAGIKNAHGHFIGFVDSDDWIDTNMYQSLYDILSSTKADISICGIKQVRNESEKIKRFFPKVIEYTQEEYIKKYFKIKSQSCEYYACNKLYKKELLKGTQYPAGLTSEDVLGTYKAILLSKKITVITQNYYYYRHNDNSITGNFSKKDFDLIKIWDKVVQYTKKHAPEYLNYADINRRRISLTLLYRMAMNGVTNLSDYSEKIRYLTKELKQDEKILLHSSIPFTRKILTILFCMNYKLTANILYTLKSPYCLFAPFKSAPSKQLLNRISLSLIIFSLIVYFEPQAFKENYFPFLIQIDKIYKILKLVCGGYILILYLKKCRISKFISITCIFQIFCLFSTIINHGSITRFFGPALTTVVMAMTAEILIHTKNFFPVIKKLLIYFRIIFLFNIITIILFDFTPLESNVYFLGIDNRWIFTYMPWICFEFLYSIHAYNKINKMSIFMFLLSECTLLWERSYAAMLLFMLWVILLIIPKLKLAKCAFTFFGGTVIANLSIVVFHIQDLFTTILKKTGKGTTLSGRTFLWDSVFELIKGRPWLGNGMQSTAYDKNFFYTNSKVKLPFLHVIHAHNTYMTTLYRYGAIGLSIFIAILCMPIKKLKQYYSNPYTNTLLVCIIITLLLGVFDTMDYSGFYFILSCAYSIGFISTRSNTIKDINSDRKLKNAK